MDFCRNMSVVTGGGGGGGNGGFPSSDYSPEEQLVVSPSSTPYSKFGVVSSSCCSVDDLFSTQNMEQEAGDVNIEWLSNLVEDCLSNTGNCIYQPSPINDQPLNVKKQHYSSVSLVDNHKIDQNQNQSTIPTPPSLQNFLSSPTGNTRTKRRRTTKLPRKPLSSSTSNYNSRSSSSWSSHQEGKDPQNQKPNHHVVMTTTSEYRTPPLLVHQAYWLADSELINVPQKESTNNNSSGGAFTTTTTTTTIDEDDEQQEFMMKMEEEEEEEESRGKDSLGNLGQPRRCAHCLSQRTPQWRAGPLGPKTLCNACGVRFKSGRLLPEYRPAKSPTFVSYKHSNSHKKVLEMRMSILPSSVHSE